MRTTQDTVDAQQDGTQSSKSQMLCQEDCDLPGLPHVQWQLHIGRFHLSMA